MSQTIEGIMVKTTNGVAVTGLFSPAWLPTVADVSQISAQLVPIVSLFWLVFQVVTHGRKSFKRKRNDDSHEG